MLVIVEINVLHLLSCQINVSCLLNQITIIGGKVLITGRWLVCVTLWTRGRFVSSYVKEVDTDYLEAATNLVAVVSIFFSVSFCLSPLLPLQPDLNSDLHALSVRICLAK